MFGGRSPAGSTGASGPRCHGTSRFGPTGFLIDDTQPVMCSRMCMRAA
jgi:hypothetical protein